MLISLTAILFAFIGIALGYGGVKLALLGGSFYYIITAAGFILTAILLFTRRAAALWVYAFIIVGTLGWAFYEVGLDWWPLDRAAVLLCFSACGFCFRRSAKR